MRSYANKMRYENYLSTRVNSFANTRRRLLKIYLVLAQPRGRSLRLVLVTNHGDGPCGWLWLKNIFSPAMATAGSSKHGLGNHVL